VFSPIRCAGAALLAFLFLAMPAQASYYGDGPRRAPVAAAPMESAKPLPERLIVRPGRYTVDGQAYDMRREGYYRLGLKQRVVYRKNLPALMSGLSWSMHPYGKDDGRGTRAELAARLPNGRVSLTCGPQIDVVQYILAGQGITSRHVGTLSRKLDQKAAPGQLPGLDHVMIEVLVKGRWQLWDQYNHGRPMVAGRPTTVIEWTKPRRDRRLVTIARPDKNITPEGLSDFYIRANGIPLVATPEQTWPFYFTDPPQGPDPAQRQRIFDYRSGLGYVPRKEFMARFYPPPA
jgi:hypothetical protein